MKTITITKTNALKALKGAKGELRQRLTDLLGTDVINQNPMDFESYEEVCEAEEIDPVKSLPFPHPKSKKEVSVNGLYKLQTIFEAFNNRCGVNFDETWEADYTDENQQKWTATWHDYVPSLGAFVCTSTIYTYTFTALGARLSTDTRDKIIRITSQFKKEWNEFLNPQI